jgi:hypothetical protein
MAKLHQIRSLSGFLSQADSACRQKLTSSSLQCEVVASCCRIGSDRQLGQLKASGVNPMHRGELMRLKFLFAMVVGFALSLGAIAQQTDDGIKQDTKDAAHSTGKAAKKTGHKIKKGTKKVVHKSADATEKGADKVRDKSAPTPTPPPQK